MKRVGEQRLKAGAHCSPSLLAISCTHFQASRDGCGAFPRGRPLAFGLQPRSAFSALAERTPPLLSCGCHRKGTADLAGLWLPVAGALLRF